MEKCLDLSHLLWYCNQRALVKINIDVMKNVRKTERHELLIWNADKLPRAVDGQW